MLLSPLRPALLPKMPPPSAFLGSRRPASRPAAGITPRRRASASASAPTSAAPRASGRYRNTSEGQAQPLRALARRGQIARRVTRVATTTAAVITSSVEDIVGQRHFHSRTTRNITIPSFRYSIDCRRSAISSLLHQASSRHRVASVFGHADAMELKRAARKPIAARRHERRHRRGTLISFAGRRCRLIYGSLGRARRTPPFFFASWPGDDTLRFAARRDFSRLRPQRQRRVAENRIRPPRRIGSRQILIDKMMPPALPSRSRGRRPCPAYHARLAEAQFVRARAIYRFENTRRMRFPSFRL